MRSTNYCVLAEREPRVMNEQFSSGASVSVFFAINCAATSTTDINQALITAEDPEQPYTFMVQRHDVRDYVNVRVLSFLLSPFFFNDNFWSLGSSDRRYQFRGSQLPAKITGAFVFPDLTRLFRGSALVRRYLCLRWIKAHRSSNFAHLFPALTRSRHILYDNASFLRFSSICDIFNKFWSMIDSTNDKIIIISTWLRTHT